MFWLGMFVVCIAGVIFWFGMFVVVVCIAGVKIVSGVFPVGILLAAAACCTMLPLFMLLVPCLKGVAGT